MKAERGFRRTILLTALIGHFAYAIAAEKPGLALVGLLAAMLSAWLVRQTLAGRPRPLPRALLNGLVIAAIAHLTLQLLGRSQEVITSLTDFLAYVMLVKSLDRLRMRDEAQLLGLSLFVVIGALLTGQSLGMGLALLAYTPLAITSAVSLQLYHARERQSDLLRSVGLNEEVPAFDAQIEKRRAPRATLAVAAFCVAASMGAGVFAFIITPRQLAQQLGMATAPFLKTPSTGFTESITLGNVGNISQDNTPVMDVRVVSGAGASAGASGPIYLRGAVLNYYNRENGVWSTHKQDSQNARTIDRIFDRTLIIPGEQTARIRTQYEIIQRNAKAEAPLFAPFHPVAVSLNAETKGKIAYREADGLLKLVSGGGGRVVYNVTSANDYLEQISGDAAPPTGAYGPRVKQLADSIMAARSINPSLFAQNPAEIRRAAQAVIGHLAAYEYTLEMTAPADGQDAIEMFLFDTKRGHCEYFSAGMVALLSSVGIPARIATGYAAAEFNNVNGYYTVRQSDAHAWVEVRMTPDRWETFDPTPAGELQSSRRASVGPIGWIKHLWDAIEFSWLDNVVAYDKGLKLDVVGLAGRADPGAAAVKWQNRLHKIQLWIRRHLPEGVLTRSLIVGVVTFSLVMGVYWLLKLGGKTFAPLRAWFARMLPGRARAAAAGIHIPADAAFYKDALAALELSGHPKPPPLPPLAFAETLEPAAADSLGRIARLYYRSRFGSAPLTADLQQQGRAALSELRAALNARTRPRT